MLNESESLAETKFTVISRYCRLGNSCRLNWLKNKGALITIAWSFLAAHVYHLLRSDTAGITNFSAEHELPQQYHPTNVSISGIILLCATLLCPVGGWIADAYLGRYKTVRCSIWIMWIGALLSTLGESLSYVSATYNDDIKPWVLRSVFVIMAVGLAGFLANIIQLGIDQLNDASTNEIKSYILWFVFVFYLSSLTTNYVTECLAIEYGMVYIRPLLVTLCLTIVICSNFLCQRWVLKEEVIGKSLTEVVRIIKYTIKHRKMRYDFAANGSSAMEELPSPFDIAKHQYGGPFTTTQVNNVRTFLWMLAVAATCAVVFGAIMPVEYAREKVQQRWEGYNEAIGIKGCYQKLTLRYEDYLLVCFLIVLYEFVVRPLFHRVFPNSSILGKFIFASGLFVLWIVSLLAIEAVAAYNGSTTGNSSVLAQECIFKQTSHDPDFKIGRMWFLIPDIFSGISCFLLVLTGIEFIWAQTPSSMKGLMFGCAYTLLGFNTLIQTIIAYPFLFSVREIDWHPLTCGVWYFLMEGALILVALLIIAVVVKKYKKRSQNRTVYE